MKITQTKNQSEIKQDGMKWDGVEKVHIIVGNSSPK